MIIKGFVAAAVSVLFVAKLISSPDRAFDWSRCILWRGSCPESKARYFARSDGAFGRKQIGGCRGDDEGECRYGSEYLTINRMDNFLRVRLITNECP